MPISLAQGLSFYFARHGQTVANVEKRFQGWSKDTPLTALGREQARNIGLILRRELGSPPHEAFVTSPLPRALTTMAIIRETMHLPPDGFKTDARLAEINLGAWDGLTDQEARERDPDEFAARTKDRWNVRVPGGGENYADVAARAESFVADLSVDTFAVSHGAFTRILRGLFLDLSWKQMTELDEPQGCVFRVRGNDVERLDLRP